MEECLQKAVEAATIEKMPDGTTKLDGMLLHTFAYMMTAQMALEIAAYNPYKAGDIVKMIATTAINGIREGQKQWQADKGEGLRQEMTDAGLQPTSVL